jgi:hypothetical protein
MPDEDRTGDITSGASGDEERADEPARAGSDRAGGAGGRAQGAGGAPDAPQPAGGAEAGRDDPAVRESAHDAGGAGPGGPPS